jgi:uncharacterized membrane protein YidH (DUF202 family)
VTGTPANRQPVDAGLQAERTLLAWQRTCLAVAVAAAVAVRFLVAEIGLGAAAVGIAALVLVVFTWIAATVRYRRAHRNLSSNPDQLGLHGIPVAALAGAAALIAVTAFLLLIANRLPR